MDLTPYVDALRRELAVVADAGGEEARALTERLTAALDAAVRLTLLEALSGAAAEITRDLAPGSVDLRLRGREPSFVVTAPSGATVAPPAVEPGDDAASARINFRLPENLKARIEAAAAAEGLSVNAWLGRAAAAAVEPERRTHRGTQRYTGWVR
ncbi:toxin-antitoxin system HicB family antitoxin [Pseudonocardia broussonetiae]|uniref:Toxin-antitoxin system HicB family antitoxin n=1 Tax=Pseudonocardia broussonetiae TaxID=2736640 RepID=A0A6M6JLB7_9PSEU|nr:toxin-antitoxin system HicB family antitoxin [Pseudonocardia broussonetiae]QJY47101.1 toxin-antitoxin system HicB family antitoxin [Pseudonocardia broussonetiae]